MLYLALSQRILTSCSLRILQEESLSINSSKLVISVGLNLFMFKYSQIFVISDICDTYFSDEINRAIQNRRNLENIYHTMTVSIEDEDKV